MTHGADLSKEADPSAPERELAAQGQISEDAGSPLPHRRGAAEGWPLLPCGDTGWREAAAGRGQKRTEGVREHLQLF